MKIGIDIDDTIADTYDFLIDKMSEYYKVDKEYLIKNNLSYINMNYELKLKEIDFTKKMFEANLKEIPLKENAKECINKLYEKGYEIYFITARQNFNNVYNSTINQLDSYGIKYTKLICITDKKTACIDNKIDVFIDDSIRNTESLNNVIKKVYLYSSIYNKNKQTHIERVENWLELYTILNNE